ncbi:MAG: hypothetical protein ABJA70_23110 [Chryseolinea sp.]
MPHTQASWSSVRSTDLLTYRRHRWTQIHVHADLLTTGGSTFLISLVQIYESIGFLAPVLILILGLLQGLAIGVEYGGAIAFVTEHSPPNRGFWTS